MWPVLLLVLHHCSARKRTVKSILYQCCHKWVFYIVSIMAKVNCYIEFKICYPKNLILFSVSVKELLELIVLRKTMFFSFSFKAFSRETDLWVTLGDFMIKDANLEGKSVFHWKSILQKRKKMWCGVDNNHICHMCTETFFILEL